MYSAYVAQIRKITDDLSEWKDEQKLRSRFQKQQYTAPQTNEPMDWEATQTTSASAAIARTSRLKDQGKTRAKWVSQQEITRRKEADQCLRCGSEGHYIGQCRLSPARKPDDTQTHTPTPARAMKEPKLRTAAAKARKTKKALTPMTSDEESDSTTESGNE
jgi:hypothetical protein